MILDWSEAKKFSDSMRETCKNVALANGVFDILHVGHLQLLRAAAREADALIVAVNSDESVRSLNKGPGRPFQCERHRAKLVDALHLVTNVVIFTDPTPLELINFLRPDVLVKGGDWKKQDIVGAKEVESWGGKVVIVPLVEGLSTTGIVERARSASLPSSLYRITVNTDDPVQAWEFDCVEVDYERENRVLSFTDAQGRIRAFNRDHIVCVTTVPLPENKS